MMDQTSTCSPGPAVCAFWKVCRINYFWKTHWWPNCRRRFTRMPRPFIIANLSRILESHKYIVNRRFAILQCITCLQLAISFLLESYCLSPLSFRARHISTYYNGISENKNKTQENRMYWVVVNCKAPAIVQWMDDEIINIADATTWARRKQKEPF